MEAGGAGPQVLLLLPHLPACRQFLLIDEELSMGVSPEFEERMAFWDRTLQKGC